MTERSDVDLMLAFQAGDESAFSALLQRHRDAVVSLTYRYLGNREDAEDLAQEIFLKIYRARSRYRPEAKFTTWLYRISVNACLNEVRNRRNRPTFRAASLHPSDDGDAAPALEDARSESPAAAVERTELRRQVRGAVDSLPERQRLALLLNKFHGLSYEELAQALDLSLQAVKSLLTRARQNLRRRIEPRLGAGAAHPRRIPEGESA
ncbi:MAG: RNA polymerase sigma factor [Planctomycetota bacterium]